jgi:hypothetical protein
MWANRDLFRNQPILTDEQLQLAPQYRYRDTTPQVYRALAEGMRQMGLPQPVREHWGSPSMQEFAVRGLGGTAAAAFAGSTDLVFNALQHWGLLEPTAFKPQTLADLELPPDASPALVDRLMNSLAREDLRPWYTRIPRLMTTAGGAQTLRTKAEQTSSPETRRALQETQAFWKEWGDIQQDFRRQEADLLQHSGEWTHEQLAEQRSKLAFAKQARFRDLQTREYPHAVVTPKERDALAATMPGIPMDGWYATLAPLPPGVTPAQVAERYRSAAPETATPYQAWQLRQQALRQMGNEYDLPVRVLRDYIGGHALGTEVPLVGVPALFIETAMDRYLHPPGTSATTPPRALGDARRAELTKMATEWGIPEADLAQRIQVRMTPIDTTDPVARSQERARRLAHDTFDPVAFPGYVDPRGAALGAPTEWAAWDAARAQWGRVPAARRPAAIRDLEAAHDRAEVLRLQARLQDPDYAHYERWFGLGRDMTVDQWERYQSGATPRYRQGTLAEWGQWDAARALYRAMPDGPDKRRLRPTVLRLERLLTPGWRALTQLEPEQQPLLDEMPAPRRGPAPAAPALPAALALRRS